MAKRKTQKAGKRSTGKSPSKSRAPARKKAAGSTKRATARKPASAKPAASGLVYTSLLREALAGRTR